jgi:hypothetical protein
MKTYGEWRYSSTILVLGNKCRWVVSFTPRPLYLRGKSPRFPLYRRLGGPQSSAGYCGDSPAGNRIPAVQSVASQYTDWAIPAHWPIGANIKFTRPLIPSCIEIYSHMAMVKTVAVNRQVYHRYEIPGQWESTEMVGNAMIPRRTDRKA